MRYRARIIIQGSTDQLLYGKHAQRLLERAIKVLTAHKPGFASLEPKRIDIAEAQESLLQATIWPVIRTVHYEDIPKDQHEWRKK